MASLVNPYFHMSQTNEQTLVNTLIKESIQVQGRTYYYLPRDVQLQDLILGEDIISKFSLAIPIELFMAEAQGFQGDKEMFSKFGLTVQNSYRLVVSKDRWEEEVKVMFDNNPNNGEALFDIANYVRPHEGDLIYDPLTKFLMEIKFVDHDAEFFQIGRNYMYHMSCESFNYQNETISTGILEIDKFNENNNDLLNFQLLAENGNMLVQEDGFFILTEEEPVNIRDFGTDTTPEQPKIDFTVTNIFNY